jgi:hypothetical protein
MCRCPSTDCSTVRQDRSGGEHPLDRIVRVVGEPSAYTPMRRAKQRPGQLATGQLEAWAIPDTKGLAHDLVWDRLHGEQGLPSADLDASVPSDLWMAGGVDGGVT